MTNAPPPVDQLKRAIQIQERIGMLEAVSENFCVCEDASANKRQATKREFDQS